MLSPRIISLHDHTDNVHRTGIVLAREDVNIDTQPNIAVRPGTRDLKAINTGNLAKTLAVHGRSALDLEYRYKAILNYIYPVQALFKVYLLEFKLYIDCNVPSNDLRTYICVTDT